MATRLKGIILRFVLPFIIIVGIGLAIVYFKPFGLSPKFLFPSTMDTQNDPLPIEEKIPEGAIELFDKTANLVLLSVNNAIYLLEIVVVIVAGAAGGLLSYMAKGVKDAEDKLQATREVVVRVKKDLKASRNKLERVRKEVKNSEKLLKAQANSYVRIQEELNNFQQGIMPPNLGQEAINLGTITQSAYDEGQQWYQWQKWRFLNDETGYQQLIAFKGNDDGLSIGMKRIILSEIDQIEKKVKKRGAYVGKELLLIDKYKELLGFVQAPLSDIPKHHSGQ